MWSLLKGQGKETQQKKRRTITLLYVRPRRSFFVDALLCGVVFGDAVVRSGNPCDSCPSEQACRGRRSTVRVPWKTTRRTVVVPVEDLAVACRRRGHCRFEIDGEERGLLVVSTTTLPRRS